MATDPDGWAFRNRTAMRSSGRKLFGLVLGIVATLKLLPGSPFWFSERVLAASIGQPGWLGGWYAFWVAQSAGYAALDVYLVMVLEFALAFALVAGFLRKTSCLCGIGLFLLIWAVAEGFGGPYSPGTFDIGAAPMYALACLLILLLEADPEANRNTLDAMIEARFPGWRRWAEVVKQTSSSHVANG